MVCKSYLNTLAEKKKRKLAIGVETIYKYVSNAVDVFLMKH